MKSSPNTADRFAQVQRWLLAAAVALVVAQVVLPADSTAVLAGAGLPFVMFWLALAAAWAVCLLGSRGGEIRFGWVDGCVALLVLWHTLSGLIAAGVFGETGQHAPRPAWNMTWQWVSFGVAFLLLRQLLSDARARRALLVVMVGMAVTQAAYGLWQMGWEIPEWKRQFEQSPEQTLREAGIANVDDPVTRSQFSSRLKTLGPHGTFALSNSFAGMLVAWIVLSLSIIHWRGSSGRVIGVRNGILAIAVLCLGVCLIGTGSRTAILACLIGGAATFLLQPRSAISGKRKLAVAGLLAVGAAAGYAVAGERIDNAFRSLQFRFEYWQATWGMIADHPLFGCGPGNFRDYYTGYMLPQASETIADPHSWIFEIWATAGTPAVLAMVAALAIFFGKVLCTAGLESSAPPEEKKAPSDVSGKKKRRKQEAPVVVNATRGFVLLGGLFGMVVAVVVAMVLVPLLQQNTDSIFMVALTGSLILGGLFALLKNWIDEGRIVLAAVAGAVLALVVNLLAAGGISTPGVAINLWVLLAIGLCEMEQGSAARTLGRPAAAGVLAVAAFATLACHQTAYGPVLSTSAAMASGYYSSDVEQHEDAAQRDPWDARPRQMLAMDWLALSWQKDAFDPEGFAKFKIADVQQRRLDPHSWQSHKMSGDWYLFAYRTTDNVEHLAQAVSRYRRAFELFPADALLAAHLAWSLHLAGDKDEAAAMAERAMLLDEGMLHGDRKLVNRGPHWGDPDARRPIRELMKSLYPHRDTAIDAGTAAPSN